MNSIKVFIPLIMELLKIGIGAAAFSKMDPDPFGMEFKL